MSKLKFDFSRHISSRGMKKSQFLNSDEEKPVSREKSHIMGTFLAFLGDIGFSSYRTTICAAGNYRSLLKYDYFDKLLQLEDVKLFSR